MRIIKIAATICSLCFTYCASYAQWSAVGNLTGTNTVGCFEEWNSKLYMTGPYIVNNDTVHGICSYNGIQFDSLAAGFGAGGAGALAIYNNELYAGGSLLLGSWPHISCSANIDKWNGTTWSCVGAGGPGGTQYITAMAVYNGELYVGGNFFSMGGVTSRYIARWDGIQWKTVGGGLWSGLPGAGIDAIAVYNNELYVGGFFSKAGNTTAYNIARWNGTKWDSLGSYGVNGAVTSLIVDSINNVLYVGGGISNAGGAPCKSVAKWDGNKFSSPSMGITNGAIAMTIYNNKLYVGGFGTTGSVTDTIVAAWDGSDWYPIVSGPNEGVTAMKEYQGKLYMGGYFTQVDTIAAKHLVRLYSPSDSSCKFLQPYIESMQSLTAPNGVADTFYYTDSDDSVAVQFYNNIASSTSWQWNFGDGNTGSGKTPLHYYAGAGTYTVSVIVNYPYGPNGPCIDTAYKTITILNNTGVNELPVSGLKFKVFPNPARAELNIEAEEYKNYLLKIFNSVGQQVAEEKFSHQIKINTGNYSKGIYQVQVCDKQGAICHTEKVILE